jgi:aspartyl-tRNA(Asn)/glutamyl-tRNA(Gln) amidotransferase subunit A
MIPSVLPVKVRTVVKQEMVAAVSDCDVLLGAVAPTAAYQFGEKLTDPLSMYVGDLMTVGLNLSGEHAAIRNLK